MISKGSYNIESLIPIYGIVIEDADLNKDPLNHGSKIAYIASVPHSGVFIPEELKRYFSETFLKYHYNSDWFLNELYEFLPELGFLSVSADISRHVIDLNRDYQGELIGDWGKALIQLRSGMGKQIYQEVPDDKEIQRRIKEYYHPYHQEIERLIKSSLDGGKDGVFLIDLHSFGRPLDYDVVLGTRDGESLDADTLDRIKKLFEEENLRTVVNQYYRGGYITRHYSKMERVRCLQIELSYNSYISLEVQQKPKFDRCEKFVDMQSRLRRIFEKIVCL